MAANHSGPSTVAGNAFCQRRPRASARWISVAVATPGSWSRPRLMLASATRSSRPGATVNAAPRSATWWTSSGDVTVPAPTT